MNKLIIPIVIATASFYLGYSSYPHIHPNQSPAAQPTKDKTPIISDKTTIQVKPKETPEAPDLIVSNRYTAEVNGETIEIPKVPHKAPTTTTVTTEINMTPVVRKLADAEYKRNWEVGTGIGKSQDGHLYIPLSLQRNYNYNKAIELQIGLSKDHIETLQVVHKWKF